MLSLLLARQITTLSLGDDVARGLGQNTRLIQGLSAVSVVLLAGALTLGVEDEAEARIQEYEAKAADARAQLDQMVGDKTVALLRVFGEEIRVEGGLATPVRCCGTRWG